MRLANALFGQVGDQVGQVKDQFGQGQGQELDNYSIGILKKNRFCQFWSFRSVSTLVLYNVIQSFRKWLNFRRDEIFACPTDYDDIIIRFVKCEKYSSRSHQPLLPSLYRWQYNIAMAALDWLSWRQSVTFSSAKDSLQSSQYSVTTNKSLFCAHIYSLKCFTIPKIAQVQQTTFAFF